MGESEGGKSVLGVRSEEGVSSLARASSGEEGSEWRESRK